MATLQFLGSTSGVTGSLYLLEANRMRILLECGLIQGRDEDEARNKNPFPFDINNIDAVVLSHAHLDHSGRLPKLLKDGFSGPIYMTRPTSELLDIMLKDAAFLGMRDAEWENKRRKRSGREEIEPLYTLEDVEETLKLCDVVSYSNPREIGENILLTFHDGGHILGSAVVELKITENKKVRTLVFSGDLGNSYAPLLRDPAVLTEADVVMMESTYGDRDHRPLEETLDEFKQILDDAADSGGNVLIPSFAVGRTQEVIFYLGELFQRGELKQQMVFLDSPMAILATEVYQRYQTMFNEEDNAALHSTIKGSLHAYLPVLRYTKTTEESMAINRIDGGCIIIAGSGMCNGGRIRHHLKHNLWKRNTHVMIVGFQVAGTTGRALVDGAKKVHLVGEEIAVKANIHTLGGFSAHAGQQQLLDWIGHFKNSNPLVYLVHGEDDAKKVLRQQLIKRKFNTQIPRTEETVTF